MNPLKGQGSGPGQTAASPPGLQVHVYLHQVNDPDPQTLSLLQQVIQQLNSMETKENTIMAALDDLTAQVASNTTVEGSALTLIQGLAAQLAAAIASGNPAALSNLQTQLKSSADALAAAVAANTPAAA